MQIQQHVKKVVKIRGMEQWLKVFENPEGLTPLLLMAAFILGFLGTFASCCNFAIIGAVTGYSGTLNIQKNKKKLVLINLSFFFGIFLSFLAIGLITSFAGQKIADTIGSYWKIFAGITLIIAGVISMELIKIKLPSINVKSENNKTGFFSTLIFGLSIGGASVVCAACCNPVFPVILGASFIHHNYFSSFLVILSFSTGYSLPFMVVLTGLGLGFETANKRLTNFGKYIKYITGGILIIVGFYFLLTF